jgi:rhamnose transport system ATP-binding protein
MAEPLLSLRNIRKSFGGTRALTDGRLDLHAGQVTALIGENGAGKSTLVKLLTGIHQPDGGAIQLDGKTLRIGSPADARGLGISVIHQESVVFDDLSVAENIFVSAHPRRLGLVDWPGMRRAAAKILARLEASIDPAALLRELGVAQKHLVQIARALSHDSRIVIMDEPTSALSHQEAQDLLRIVRRLRDDGRAVLFISHKFEEIFAIADRYVVRTEQLCRHPEFSNVSLSVRQGEILGIYGLVGAGRSEVMQALFGITQPDSGRILIDGREARIRAPSDAIRHKLAYVPEDRQQQGAILPISIRDNIALASLQSLATACFTNTRRSQHVAQEWLGRLQIRAAAADQTVAELSGGNQQKVVIAKWLQTAPRVLILDEPTKGIDVGSKAAVHSLMSELVQKGLAVILVSSELPEVLAMADRILVMRRGRVRAHFERADASAEALVRAATDA